MIFGEMTIRLAIVLSDIDIDNDMIKLLQSVLMDLTLDIGDQKVRANGFSSKFRHKLDSSHSLMVVLPHSGSFI
jgi:hypothetical protein